MQVYIFMHVRASMHTHGWHAYSTHRGSPSGGTPRGGPRTLKPGTYMDVYMCMYCILPIAFGKFNDTTRTTGAHMPLRVRERTCIA